MGVKMRYLFAAIILMVFTNLAYSQDIITLKNGERLRVKVVQVNEKNVIYKSFDDKTGKLDSVDYSNIFIIIFEKNNAKYQQKRKSGIFTKRKK